MRSNAIVSRRDALVAAGGLAVVAVSGRVRGDDKGAKKSADKDVITVTPRSAPARTGGGVDIVLQIENVSGHVLLGGTFSLYLLENNTLIEYHDVKVPQIAKDDVWRTTVPFHKTPNHWAGMVNRDDGKTYLMHGGTPQAIGIRLRLGP